MLLKGLENMQDVLLRLYGITYDKHFIELDMKDEKMIHVVYTNREIEN